jgi:predicted PurR-regulated permease PerM
MGGVAMSLARTNFLRGLIVVVSLYVAYQASSVFLPLILSLVIAFILNPFVNGLSTFLSSRRRKFPRSLAVIITMAISFLLFFSIISFIFLPFVNEFNKFVQNLPLIFEQLHTLALVVGERANNVDLPSNVRNIIDQGLSSATAFSIDFAKRTVVTVFSIASHVVELVVIPVLVYYFLKDGCAMEQAIIHLFSPGYRTLVQSILQEMAATIGAYLHGQVLISVIMGITVFCGLYWLDVDYPLVIALLAFLTETIPIIGPIIGAVPAVLLAYLISPELAMKVTVFYVVVHQLDSHVIVPNIMGHTIALHPVVVIISVLVASQLFGIIGMMMAVPVAALLRVFIRHLQIVG